jgi:transcriptional regulator with GAF, ATPase, and Fis domain
VISIEGWPHAGLAPQLGQNNERPKAQRSKEMAANASWAIDLPAINHNASFEIEDTNPAKVALDNKDELCGSGLPCIVGNSVPLRRVLGMVRIVAPTDATVLINGETGTGKELIAEAIHRSSDRSNGPFVKVNCAAIPAGLLESELFGHERGAYTGAFARAIGRFERANRGTLFLDEIGDLPLELQPKILRVLQERQFERLGGAVTIHTDVRVICATHRNLFEMIKERQFRADLFYRLSVFPIELPPLRDRPEDIPLLVRHFVKNYAARMHKPITAISEEFIAALVRYSWPGNVRELQNFIERSVILSPGTLVHGSLPELTHTTRQGSKESELSAPVTLEDAERSHILQTLQKTGGVIGGRNGAAAKLGLPRTTLMAKLTRLGIKRGRSSALPVRAEAPVLVSEDPILRTPPLSRSSHEAASSGNSKPHSDVRRVCTLAEAERDHISEALEMTNRLIAGKRGAAEVLGVPPSTLRHRMKKLGINC